MGENTRLSIEQFLTCRRLALVGLSRTANDFSRMVFREFRQRGYDVVPVNPLAPELDGVRCFARVSEIQPPVEAALLMTPPKGTEEAVRDCEAAGVRRVWMHRSAGTGSVSPDAVDYCRRQGIDVVAGECPLMFLAGTSWFHRAHRFFRGLRGRGVR
jgi:predicted CoA-binding protein